MPWIETTAIAVALREVPGASSMEWTDKQLKKLENAAKKAGVDVRLPLFVIDPLGLLVPSPLSLPPHTHISPTGPAQPTHTRTTQQGTLHILSAPLPHDRSHC